MANNTSNFFNDRLYVLQQRLLQPLQQGVINTRPSTPASSTFSSPPPVSDQTSECSEEGDYNQQESRHIEENLSFLENLQDSQFPDDDILEATDRQSTQNFDPEVLIELVRQFPCIWNVRLNVYRDQTKKKVAWENISSAFGGSYTVDFLKSQWKLLRDAYRRCLAKRENQCRSGAAASKLAKCKYFSVLTFLQDSIGGKETDSNIDMDEDITIQSASLSATPRAENPQVSSRLRKSVTQDVETSSSKKSRVEPYHKPISSRGKRTEDPSESVDKMLLTSLNNVSTVCEQISESNKERTTNTLDSDLLFCQSLVDNLKRLPPRKNQLARIKMQQVLYELEVEDDNRP